MSWILDIDKTDDHKQRKAAKNPPRAVAMVGSNCRVGEGIERLACVRPYCSIGLFRRSQMVSFKQFAGFLGRGARFYAGQPGLDMRCLCQR